MRCVCVFRLQHLVVELGTAWMDSWCSLEIFFLIICPCIPQIIDADDAEAVQEAVSMFTLNIFMVTTVNDRKAGMP